jgi:hypothetical protein
VYSTGLASSNLKKIVYYKNNNKSCAIFVAKIKIANKTVQYNSFVHVTTN